jgi:hypothetical protein
VQDELPEIFVGALVFVVAGILAEELVEFFEMEPLPCACAIKARELILYLFPAAPTLDILKT